MTLQLLLSDRDRERFHRFLQRDEATGCLLFTGSRLKGGRGHGRFNIKGRLYLAHRVAFLDAGGVLTEQSPDVLHDCPFGDLPHCCELTHLRAGTQAENVLDMARKGRGCRSKSGLPFGVKLHKSGRYEARAALGGRLRYFGTYPSWQEASAIAFFEKNRFFFTREAAS